MSAARFDPRADFALLRELFDEIDQWLARPREELLRVAPAVSGWNAEQHIAHVSLANELITRNLKSLIRGSGPLVLASGEPVPGALEILVSGTVPRGQAQAPRMVRPPETVERAYLVEWLAENRRGFAEAEAQLAELEAATSRIPHQVLGPLSAAQWVRFAAIHTRHHLAIARDVLAERS